MTIAELNRRVKSIDLNALKTDAFDAVKDDIAIFNREQLAKGKNANNEDLGDYGGYYREMRGEAGYQVDYVDLKRTGKLYESIYARLEGDTVEIFSTDNAEKVQSLIFGGNGVRKGGFGEEIFGLTDENKDKTKELSINEIINIVKYITNL